MRPTVFVCDASIQGEAIGRALRSAGYAVVDVPLALLVSRVAAQLPSLVLLDIDADDALEIVRRLRDIPGATSIELIFIGEPERTFGDTGDALARDADAFFSRPIDASALLSRIAALVPVDGSTPRPHVRALARDVLINAGEPADIVEALPESVAPPSFSEDPLGMALAGAASASLLAQLFAPPSSAPPPPRVDAPPAASAESPDSSAPVSLGPPITPRSEVGAPSTSVLTNVRTGEKTGINTGISSGIHLAGGSSPGVSISTATGVGATGPSGASGVTGVTAGTGASTTARKVQAPPFRGDVLTDVPASSPNSPPIGTQLSDDIQRVLALAEQRVAAFVSSSSNPPSPEDEIEAVLPADILDALDEPIDHEDDDNENISDTGARKDNVLTPIPADAADGRPEYLSPTPGHVAAILAPPVARPTAHDRRSSAPPTHARPFGAPDEDLPFPSDMRRAMVFDDASEPPGGMASVRAITPSEPVISMPSDHPRRDGGFHRASPPPASSDQPPLAPLGAGRAPSFDVVSPRWAQPSVLPSTPRPPMITQPAGARAAAPAADARRVDSLGHDRDGLSRIAEAVAARFSGALTIESAEGARSVVLRDGDFVTVSPANDAESLVAFLVSRGELPRDAAQRLSSRLPSTGRHAGAALVAHGLLGQDDLWTTLRSHAEWLLGILFSLAAGTVIASDEVPVRLRSEPSVFGGSAGAEVLVEVTRRFIPPEQAIRVLGGSRARVGDGSTPRLLSECALSHAEAELADRARGFTVGEVLQAAHQPDFASVLLALVRLGVFATLAPAGGASLAPPPPQDPLDEEALRSRIKARLALVDEGDYFAILGVPRTATPYEIRRAYTSLRRTFEPSRVLSPTTTDLAESLRLILEVLDEAFEILRDPTRRERYRRAIESPPG